MSKVGIKIISWCSRFFKVNVTLCRCKDCKSYDMRAGFRKDTPKNGRVASMLPGVPIYSKWKCENCGKVSYTKTQVLKNEPRRKRR